MLFRKKDDATRLIDLVRSEQKQLDDLNDKLEALRPQWLKAQEKVESLISKKEAHFSSYRRPAQDDKGQYTQGGIYEPFYQQRKAELDSAIVEAIQQRDALTADIVSDIKQQKSLISRRRDIIVFAFIAWADSVCSVEKYVQIRGQETQYELDDSLRLPLLEFRQQLRNSDDDLQTIIESIQLWVEKVEEVPNLRIPLFRFDDAITRALAA